MRPLLLFITIIMFIVYLLSLWNMKMALSDSSTNYVLMCWNVIFVIMIICFFMISGGDTKQALKFTSTPVTEVIVGETYTYNVSVNKIKYHNIILNATTIPNWLSLIDNIGTFAILTGKPIGTSSVGTTNVLLTANSIPLSKSLSNINNISSYIDKTTTQPFSIVVSTLFASTPQDQSVQVGNSITNYQIQLKSGVTETYTYGLNVTDSSGNNVADNLTLSIDTNTNTLEGTIPTGTATGTYTITINAENSGNIVDSQSFTMTIS